MKRSACVWTEKVPPQASVKVRAMDRPRPLPDVYKRQDGLTALRDTQGKAQHQDVDLGDDPNTRQGNVLTVVGERTVVGQGIVEGDLHQKHEMCIRDRR